MRKSLLIVRSNIKKAKGQTAAILVLILLAAAMLNLWLMLSMDYKANFDRYHDKLHAEDVTLTVSGNSRDFREFLAGLLEGDSRTHEYSLEDCMHMVGTFSYNGGALNAWLVFLEKQTALERPIGSIEIVEEGPDTSGVYLPLLYRSEDIDLGKTFELTIGTYKAEYTVCGFFNSVMMGSHNCAMTEIVLTQDQYSALEESGLVPQATLCGVRLKDRQDNLGYSYEAWLKGAVSEGYPNILMSSNCYDMVAQSRYISQMICSGIISAAAAFVLVIALVVVSSNIVNYIQVNMRNLGALKAVGYTSGQLIRCLLLQFLSLTFLGGALGTGLSYLLFPAVNTMMIRQTGVPYALRFLPVPFVITLGALAGTVGLCVWLTAGKMKKIEPIAALRSGIQTHSFRRNPVPLEKTKAPLNLALALKITCSGVKHNVTVCITMLVLSLVVVFSGLMTENVINDMTPFVNMIVGEMADSCISVQSETEDAFLKEANLDSRVEKAYLYTSLNVAHEEGAELMATLCDDFSKVSNPSVVFEGRFPKYDNEIAIAGKYAKEQGFQLGEEIEITANGKQETYLICGFTQISNNLGRDCLLTRAGYERLGALTDVSYYLNLTEGTDIDGFHLEMKQRFGSSVNATINILTTVEAAAGVYVSLMRFVVMALLALSAVIIGFVLYLLVRTMLNNLLRYYGILKALGFTTRQLILQTALSFMPSAILSTAVGLTVFSFVINPLTALFLSGIGIVKCAFTVPLGFIALAGAGLILLAFGTVCLLSLKIRKIAPRNLLSGE